MGSVIGTLCAIGCSVWDVRSNSALGVESLELHAFVNTARAGIAHLRFISTPPPGALASDVPPTHDPRAPHPLGRGARYRCVRAIRSVYLDKEPSTLDGRSGT